MMPIRVQQAVRWFAGRESMIVSVWIVAVMIIAAMKAATAPTPPAHLMQALAMTLPFLIVAAAPVFGYRLGKHAFATPSAMQQPALRLAHYGAWRAASPTELATAREGWPGLAWISLVSGVLFNVPLRALEYLVSIPAVSAADPAWAHVVVQSFTLDCAVMCFVYTACFAAAVRRSPLFPRALVAAWLLDAVLQGMIASRIGATGSLPASLIEPLGALLQTNVKKVAISAAIWLPYLLVSESVNLRLRHRVRISQGAVPV